MTVLIRVGQPAGAGPEVSGAAVLVSLTAFALLAVVYFNLVTTLVARREELMLKRFRTGEMNDGEILAGSVAPAVALAWSQIVLAAIVGVAALHLGRPVNPVLVLVAALLGTAVFVLLAAVTTVATPTVEMAQVTATPVLIASAFVGVLGPVGDFPEPIRLVASVLPMPRVVELLNLGLTGSTAQGGQVGTAASFGHALVPVLILLAWVSAAGWATRRWFRWEPRR
jgi:ABC-2 type transport system permease protein